MPNKHVFWVGDVVGIPAFKLGGTWRFRRSELDLWIATGIAAAAHKKNSTE
ncbi:helix-turn-helix domain-containing protein [Roseateles sp. LYH14W]|uniref:Helix-turn-helix domain-containing protein n=1 Tax=Pelomonas parva TaxID=3299032 RepID=A0ABW7F5F5_9BURK